MKAGPPILIAITKVDIYPEWRRIVAIDEGHLATRGPDRDAVRVELGAARPRSRHGRPGPRGRERVPGVRRGARRGRGRSRPGGSLSTAIAQVLPALDQLREPLAAEVTALENPEAAEALAADLRDVRERLAALAEADASWSVRLEDEFTALRTRTAFAFQARMRAFVRETQDEIERIDPARAWPEVGQRIQAETAANVRAAFLEATDGAAAIQAHDRRTPGR